MWARAGVLGTVGLASGVVSHAAGGGLLPGVLPMLLLACLSVGVAAAFLRRRAGVLRLVGLVVGAQTAVHAALSGLAGHAGAARPPVPATPAGALPAPPGPTGEARTGSLFDHYASSAPVPAGAPTHPDAAAGGWLAHQLDHLTAQGPVMVLAHVAGAAVLGLLLAVGEDALWRLVGLVAVRCRIRVARLRMRRDAASARCGVAMAGARVRRPVERLPVPRPRLDHPVRRRRGPPLLLAG